jgi:hypothetical protein
VDEVAQLSLVGATRLLATPPGFIGAYQPVAIISCGTFPAGRTQMKALSLARDWSTQFSAFNARDDNRQEVRR